MLFKVCLCPIRRNQSELHRKITIRYFCASQEGERATGKELGTGQPRGNPRLFVSPGLPPDEHQCRAEVDFRVEFTELLLANKLVNLVFVKN